MNNNFSGIIGVASEKELLIKIGKITAVHTTSYTCDILLDDGGMYYHVDMALPIFDYTTGSGFYYMPTEYQRVVVGISGNYTAYILSFLPRMTVLEDSASTGILRDEIVSTVNNRLNLQGGDMALTCASGSRVIIRNHAEAIELRSGPNNTYTFTGADNKQDINTERFRMTTDSGVFDWESATKSGNGHSKGDTKFSALIKQSVREEDKDKFIRVEAGSLDYKNSDAEGSPAYILTLNICNKFKLGIDVEGNVNISGNGAMSHFLKKIIRQAKEGIYDHSDIVIDHIEGTNDVGIREDLAFHIPDKVAVKEGLEEAPISFPPKLGDPSTKNTDISNAPYMHPPKKVSPPKNFPTNNALGNKIVKDALTWLQKPIKYRWGGTGAPSKKYPGYLGYDCSGFVQKLLKENGVSVGRTTRVQAAEQKSVPIKDFKKLHTKGIPIENAVDIKPGDSIYFADDADPKIRSINHVAIYVGDGKMIHCARYTGIYEKTGRDGIVLESIDHSLLRKRITRITRPGVKHG